MLISCSMLLWWTILPPPDGSKSLYVNTDASANGWYSFTVDGLKANT